MNWPSVSSLQRYNFECIGTFWDSKFHPEAAVYAFVARKSIVERYCINDRKLERYGRDYSIASSEIFYIGSTEGLSHRMADHKHVAN
jgi:hypothetical protein